MTVSGPPIYIPPRSKRNEPREGPGVCVCEPPCIDPIPIFPNSQKKERLMIPNATDAQNLGIFNHLNVSQEQYKAAHARRTGRYDAGDLTTDSSSPYSEHDDNFEALTADETADGDNGVPATDDDSVDAECQRAKNHLEAHLDGDSDEDFDHLTAARTRINAAIAKRGGTGKKAGVHFER